MNTLSKIDEKLVNMIMEILSEDDVENNFDNLLENYKQKNFIGSCVIGNTEYDDCTRFFNKVLRGVDICYTFNQLPVDEIFYDNV